MAIIPVVPGITVTIRSDKTDLTEYPHGLPIDRTIPTIANYVECFTNAEFTIQIQLRAPYKFPYSKIIAKVQIDGEKVPGVIPRKDWYEKNGKKLDSSVEGAVEESSNKLFTKNFKFAEILQIADGFQHFQNAAERQRFEKAGIITVDFFRWEMGVQAAKVTKPNMHRSSLQNVNTKVQETSMKGEAKSHMVMCGDRRIFNGTARLWCGKNLDVRPIARFKFYYRCREALKTLMVIPRSPEPEPRPQAPSSQPIQSIETPVVEDDSLDLLSPEEQSIYKMLQSKMKHSSKKAAPVAIPALNHGAKEQIVDLTID